MVLIFTIGRPIHANTIALSFTGGTVSTPNDPGFGSWIFSTNEQILITDFGVWDENGDGIAQQEVDLSFFNGVGFNPVGSAVIPQGASAPLIDGFRYVHLSTPIQAFPGLTYFLISGGSNTFVSEASITTAPQISYLGPFASGFSNGPFGANFQFTPVAPNGGSVPDTGNSLFLILGSVGAFCAIHVWRKKPAL